MWKLSQSPLEYWQWWRWWDKIQYVKAVSISAWILAVVEMMRHKVANCFRDVLIDRQVYLSLNDKRRHFRCRPKSFTTTSTCCILSCCVSKCVWEAMFWQVIWLSMAKVATVVTSWELSFKKTGVALTYRISMHLGEWEPMQGRKFCRISLPFILTWCNIMQRVICVNRGKGCRRKGICGGKGTKLTYGAGKLCLAGLRWIHQMLDSVLVMNLIRNARWLHWFYFLMYNILISNCSVLLSHFFNCLHYFCVNLFEWSEQNYMALFKK